jgi:hypothetical protein
MSDLRPGIYHPDPDVDASVRADALEAELFDLAASSRNPSSDRGSSGVSWRPSLRGGGGERMIPPPRWPGATDEEYRAYLKSLLRPIPSPLAIVVVVLLAVALYRIVVMVLGG